MEVANKKEGAGGSKRRPLLSDESVTAFRNLDTTKLPQTLNSNTGLNSQPAFTVAIDWLDITFRQIADIHEIEQILGEVEALVDDQLDFSPSRATTNGRYWDGSGRGLRGTLIFYDAGKSTEDDPTDKPKQLKICMSGSVIGPANQQAIAYWLNGRAEKNQLDCTRIDIALDDHEKFIELGKIAEAVSNEDFFNTSYSAIHKSGKRGETKGVSYLFGSPKSDKNLIVYDKTVESNNRILGNRWEARFKRKAAGVAVYDWISAFIKSDDTAARWCVDVVLGVVDFRDRSGDDPNRNRCAPLRWFELLAQRLRSYPIRIRVAAIVPTVQRSIDWVQKSVAPTLSLLKSVLQDQYNNFLESVVYEGGVRLSNQKRELINTTDVDLLYF